MPRYSTWNRLWESTEGPNVTLNLPRAVAEELLGMLSGALEMDDGGDDLDLGPQMGGDDDEGDMALNMDIGGDLGPEDELPFGTGEDDEEGDDGRPKAKKSKDSKPEKKEKKKDDSSDDKKKEESVRRLGAYVGVRR